MRKALKRSLSLLLAITIIFGSAYAGLSEVDWGVFFAVKAEAASEGDLAFELNEDGESYSVFKCDGEASGEIVIPSTYNGLPVTSIGDSAFEECSRLTSITIPGSVKRIGDYAFSDCSSLTSITIPDSVTSVGAYAFNRTGYYNDSSNWEDDVLYIGNHLIEARDSLSGEYTIKVGTKIIADSAFEECSSLTSITIPDGVISIGNGAFEYCEGLTSITIPDGVTSIDKYAFSDCSSLTSITIPDSVTSVGAYAFNRTGYYNDSSNWEDDVLYIGNHLIKARDSLSGEYTIKVGTKIIADSAFEECSSLTSITIPDSVKSIGDDAFYFCSRLTSVTIPDSVITIGDEAFFGCSRLTSITIPDSVISIGDYAFYYCSSLISITIPDSVTSIGVKAFYGCSSLISITIPDSVTSIGVKAFYGCSSLTSINADDNNPDYSSEDGVLFDKDKTILIQYPAGKTAISYTIPDGVISIGNGAFCNCKSLTSVTIPKSVTIIGDDAFSKCTSLTSITIPDSVISIGHSAFYGCSRLISVTIPDSVINISWEAFVNTGYYNDSSNWEDDVLYIGNHLIEARDSLSGEYTIKVGTKIIGACAFRFCESLTSITIPDSVINISEEAFYGCSSLTSITIPDSVINIGEEAFYDCSSLSSVYYNGSESKWANITIGKYNDPLNNATIHYGTTDEQLFQYSIENGAVTITGYSGTDTNVVIPSVIEGLPVTSIGDSAFSFCESLTSIIIPDGVTSIGDDAFYCCSSLVSIIIPDSVISIGSGAFENTAYYDNVDNWENGVLYVSKHLICANKYDEEEWEYVGNIKGDYCIKPGTKTIACYAFDNCTDLTSITIPDSVTSIGEYAFSDCSSLTSITIPDGVTSIGDYAFSHCENLTSITIPDSVTRIGSGAFQYCSSLTSVTIPDNVTSIGDEVFYECYSLTSVTIPDNVTSIGYMAFYYCESLTSITIPDSITSVGYMAFYYCESLTSITIPDNVTSIGWEAFVNTGYYNDSSNWEDDVLYIGKHLIEAKDSLSGKYTIKTGTKIIADSAFKDCSSLTSITIPDSVTSIGVGAFCYCESLTSITIPKSVTSIGEEAFYDCSSLTSVYYNGSESEWANITIGEYNKPLNNATIHYGSTDHNYSDWVVTLKPTCTEEGYRSKTCSDCGDVVTETIEALGHDYSNWVVISEPTCTNTGSQKKACPDCGDVVIETINALGHDYSTEWTIDKAATCTEDGSKSHHCSRCDGKSDVTVISAIGHNYSDWVVTSEPTCTRDGTRKQTCSNCGDVVIETINALGHDYSTEWTIDKAATCTEDGSKSHRCSRCDSKSDVTVIPATGHNYSDWVVTLIPSCTKDGSKKQTCSNCGDVVTEAIEALGHDYSTEWTVDKAATCTVDGSKSRHCSRCDSKSEVTVIEAIGHIYGDWLVTSEPTCTRDGTRKQTCSNCGDVVIETINALGHDYSTEWTIDKAATCTEDGSKSHHCSRCDGKSEVTVIEAIGHIYGDWLVTSEPTCTNAGSQKKTCSVCHNIVTEAIEALGHDYSTEWTVDKAATCTVDGSKSHHCSRCDSKSEVTVIEATGHIYGDWIIDTEATVLSVGAQHRICSVCDNEEAQVIEKVEIDIDTNTDYGLAVFTVVHAQTLEPINGAQIFISTENDGENTFTTDSNGQVSVILPVGKQVVSAYAEGCLTRNLKVNVKSGVNEIPQIGLSELSTYDAEITSTLMTIEEIEEAGIDTSDPDNRHVYKYELKLEFEAEIDWYSFFYYLNDAGDVVGGGSSGGAGGYWVPNSNLTTNSSGGYFYIPATEEREAISVYPVSEYFYLIVRGEVRWLKEMFDVEMLVINNSLTDTLEDLTATLELPKGLSLAKMVGEQQSLAQQIDHIAEGESKSVHWYVRGDKEGSYNLQARLQGTVMPFEEEIDDLFIAENQLQVLAGNALSLHFEFPDAAYYDEDYPITITLTNISDRTLYNISHMIQIEQGMTVYYSDGSSKTEVDTSTWKSSGIIRKFNPGDKIIIETPVNIFFKSKMMEREIQKYIGFIDGIEQLINGYKAVTATFDIIKFLDNCVAGCSKAMDDFIASTAESSDKMDLFKELHDKLSSLYTSYSTSGNKTFDAAVDLANSGLSASLNAITTDPDLWLTTHSVEDIKALLDDVSALENSIVSSSKPSRKFDIFDSIRTAISAVPIRFALKNVIVTEDENNTTSIPWSYSTTTAGPQYFGVSNVSKYLMFLIQVMGAEVYEASMPGIFMLIPGLDDPFNKDEAIKYIQATEDEIAQFKAKDATGEVKFKAWVERNEASTYSLRSTSVSDDFILECDNETAKYEDGVLTFTGEGMVSVTPKSQTGGTLYIEDSKGNLYTYVIDVVEQHTCTSGEREVVISPTAEFDGFAVKCCTVCGDIMEIEPLAYSDCCEEHSFAEWVEDERETCTDSILRSRCCSVCGFTETEVVSGTNHKFVDGVCSVCGAEKSVDIPFDYEVSDDSVTITGSDSTNGEVIIPDEINGLPVTEIGSSAFKGSEDITSIVIPESVMNIGDSAFENCDSLEYIFYPGSEIDWENITIGENNTALTEAIIHYNSTGHSYEEKIDVKATCTEEGSKHQECSVCGYSLKSEVISVLGHDCSDEWTIDYEPTCTEDGSKSHHCTRCSYKEDVTTISATGHRYGDWIVDLEPTCTEYGSKSRSCTICESTNNIEIEPTGHDLVDDVCQSCGFGSMWQLKKVDTGLEITGYIGTDSNVVIPAVLAGLPVTSIGYRAFYDCDNINSITIPDSVINIDGSAFVSCDNLTQISVDENNPYYFSAEGILFNNDMTKLVAYPAGKQLNEYTIPDSVTNIGQNAFYGCSSLTSVIIPDSVKSLGMGAFYGCQGLSSVVIGNGVTEILPQTFMGCSGLVSIALPVSLTKMHFFNLSFLKNLKYVFYSGTQEQWREIILVDNASVLSSAVIHFEATGHTYSEWNITSEATCTEDGSRTKICSVCNDEISESILSYGHSYELQSEENKHPHTIVSKCSLCEDVKTETPYISTCLECNFSVTMIDSTEYKLISYVGTQTQVVVPAIYDDIPVSTISNSCFKGNTEITSVDIETGVTTIGSLAFMNCSALEKVVIPESVMSIGTHAFYGFTGTIYCKKGSYAHKYAIANNIKCAVEREPAITETENTEIDYDNFIIRTSVQSADDVVDILGLSEDVVVIATASYIHGNLELYGTGTIVTVFDGDDYIGDFTLIVDGDINGDSVVDVLDSSQMALASSGKKALEGAYALAADSNSDDVIDISDYQDVVNKAVS